MFICKGHNSSCSLDSIFESPSFRNDICQGFMRSGVDCKPMVRKYVISYVRSMVDKTTMSECRLMFSIFIVSPLLITEVSTAFFPSSRLRQRAHAAGLTGQQRVLCLPWHRILFFFCTGPFMLYFVIFLQSFDFLALFVITTFKKQTVLKKVK